MHVICGNIWLLKRLSIVVEEKKKPVYDSHVEKWSGYFKNEVDAEKHLRKQMDKLSEDLLIISAKKELVPDEKHKKKDVECHGLYLFKFVVITADKNVNP